MNIYHDGFSGDELLTWQRFSTGFKIYNIFRIYNEEYRRLARHSPRAEANIVKACNTMQSSHKIS